MSEKEQLPSAVDDAADVMSQYDKPSYDDPAPVKQYEGPELLHMTHPSLKKVPTEVNVEEEDLNEYDESSINSNHDMLNMYSNTFYTYFNASYMHLN